jgi:anti-sigma factor RsiW
MDDPSTVAAKRDLDVVKRDRFELLSAYLDGEVTPDERRLVDRWLREDDAAQCLYHRLLHLREGFHGLCQSSWSPPPADETAQGVINRLNHRFNLTCMAGFAAAAIAVVGTLSGAIAGRHWGQGFLQARLSEEPADTTMAPTAPLHIALDQPAITIPGQAAAATLASDLRMDRVVEETRADVLPLDADLVESEL